MLHRIPLGAKCREHLFGMRCALRFLQVNLSPSGTNVSKESRTRMYTNVF